jgi:hypothetical protein
VSTLYGREGGGGLQGAEPRGRQVVELKEEVAEARRAAEDMAAQHDEHLATLHTRSAAPPPY